MRNDNRLHFSDLKRIGQSPAHYKHALTAPHVDTPAMRLGRAVHAYVLGTPEPLVYEGERRGKAWAEFSNDVVGRDIITTSEEAKARAMCASVMNNPIAFSMIVGGDKEKEILWDYCGRPMSSRPDVVVFREGALSVIELKTSTTADPRRFTGLALRMAYHAQLACYCAATKAERGSIVVVESTAPYPVTVMTLTPRALEQGAKLCRLWLERLTACELADHWPGYVEAAVELDVPEELDLTFGEDAE